MKDITKEERISKELERISQPFLEVDANQKIIVAPLLQNSAFMKVTLEDLQEIINREGVTETYQNGANQRGVKQSATLQSYNSLIKNYASVTKTLSQLLPPAVQEDALQSFFEDITRERTEEELEAERKQEEERQRALQADFEEAEEYQRQQRARAKA